MPRPASVSSSHCRVVGRVLDGDLLFAASGIADGVDPDRDASADARDVARPCERGAAGAVEEDDRRARVVSRPPVRQRVVPRCVSTSNDCGGSRPQLLPVVVFLVTETSAPWRRSSTCRSALVLSWYGCTIKAMPKRVDHAERRRQIVEAVCRITVKGGLASATFREVAAEAGVSVRLVQYYFGTKDELMLSTQRYVAETGQRRASTNAWLRPARRHVKCCMPSSRRSSRRTTRVARTC